MKVDELELMGYMARLLLILAMADSSGVAEYAWHLAFRKLTESGYDENDLLKAIKAVGAVLHSDIESDKEDALRQEREC